MSNLKSIISALALVGLAACASSGVIPTGQDTYMITKKGAGGMFTNGSAVKADLYVEANQFCATKGKVVDTVNANSQNAIPFARLPNAELEFRCIDARPAPAASAPG